MIFHISAEDDEEVVLLSDIEKTMGSEGVTLITDICESGIIPHYKQIPMYGWKKKDLKLNLRMLEEAFGKIF